MIIVILKTIFFYSIFRLIVYLINIDINNIELLFFVILLSVYSNYFIETIISTITVLFITLMIHILFKKEIIRNNNKLIIYNGKINFKVLEKNGDFEYLISEMKKNNIKSIDEIKTAMLKSDEIVFELIENENPIFLIIDGKVIIENLMSINKDNKWLNNILKNKCVKISDISYAFYKNNKCFIIRN